VSLADAYEKALDEAIAIQGPLSGATSRQLPNLSGGDWLTLFGLAIPSLVAAIQHVNASGDKIPSASVIDLSSGSPLNTATTTSDLEEIAANVDADAVGLGQQIDSGDVASIDAQSYLAGLASQNYAWVRYNVKVTSTELVAATPESFGFTPWVPDGSDQLSGLRDLIDEYQRELVTVSYFVVTYGNQTVPAKQADDFHNAMTTLCAKCDAVVETTVASLGDRIQGGLRAALGKSEDAVQAIGKAAGKAAAELGNIAGQTAGQFASGFFSQATLLTLAVAGVAVYYIAVIA